MVYNDPKIDLNSLAAFSCTGELSDNYDFGDTTLRLECSGYGGSKAVGCDSSRANSREQSSKSAPNDGRRLVLGLGPTPSIYYNDYCSAGNKSNQKPSLESVRGLSCEGDSVLKLGLSNHSSISKSDPNPFSNHIFGIPVLDEGSTSAKKSGGYMPSLLLAPRLSTKSTSLPQKRKLFKPREESNHGCPEPSYEHSVVSDYLTGTTSDHQTSSLKKCKLSGCMKGAKGATPLCIGHGEGKRCQHLGCMKSTEGQTEYCIAHDGGRRCSYPTGCSKNARGKSRLCIKHGGGKRCMVEVCSRSAEGQVGLCISHGGGKRCRFHGCTKGAQGSTMYCKAHGGGKRCVFSGCTKGSEGITPLCKAHGGGKRCFYEGGGICPKSVHGGTNFCVAHGGGKRCTVPGCTKSARGRTTCCVKHGGGKRCKFDNCTKSAQGTTDFCKAHGGGKRCTWGGEGKCNKAARGRGGLCAAHGTMVQASEGYNENGIPGIGPRLFYGLVPGPCGVLNSINWLEKPAKRRQLIPPQVLVPSSMMSSSFSSFTRQLDGSGTVNTGGRKSFELVVPEGRVHGGGLLSLLGGNLKDAVIDGI